MVAKVAATAVVVMVGATEVGRVKPVAEMVVAAKGAVTEVARAVEDTAGGTVASAIEVASEAAMEVVATVVAMVVVREVGWAVERPEE